MSFKKLFLIAAVVVALTSTTALADTIVFGCLGDDCSGIVVVESNRTVVHTDADGIGLKAASGPFRGADDFVLTFDSRTPVFINLAGLLDGNGDPTEILKGTFTSFVLSAQDPDTGLSSLNFIGVRWNLSMAPRTRGFLGDSEAISPRNFIIFFDDGGVTSASIPVSAIIPEPASLVLLGTGLLGIAGALRRKLLS